MIRCGERLRDRRHYRTSSTSPATSHRRCGLMRAALFAAKNSSPYTLPPRASKDNPKLASLLSIIDSLRAGDLRTRTVAADVLRGEVRATAQRHAE